MEKLLKLDLSQSEYKKYFKYDFKLGEYLYTFPVYSCNHEPVLFCKMGVDKETSEVFYQVCDSYGRLYPAYYNRCYSSNNRVVSLIDKKINAKFRQLGVKKHSVKKVRKTRRNRQR